MSLPKLAVPDQQYAKLYHVMNSISDREQVQTVRSDKAQYLSKLGVDPETTTLAKVQFISAVLEMNNEANGRGGQASLIIEARKAISAIKRMIVEDDDEVFTLLTTEMTKAPLTSTTPIIDVLLWLAYQQASVGKGKERHANDLPFHEQPMQTISHMLKSTSGMAFQAIKKVHEGESLPSPERRLTEYLGAINYLCGMIIFPMGI